MASVLYQITLQGKTPSGKNQQGFDPVRHHKYPDKTFQAWVAQHQWSVKGARSFFRLAPFPLTQKVACSIRYVPGDLITRDVPGIQDAVFYLLGMKAGCVVKDDGLIADMDFKTLPLNRKFPEILVQISEREYSES